jgi:hypothetical protein
MEEEERKRFDDIERKIALLEGLCRKSIFLLEGLNQRQTKLARRNQYQYCIY